MNDLRLAAQTEAERSFTGFMRWTKITVWGSLAFFLAVASCNFGVETGIPAPTKPCRTFVFEPNDRSNSARECS